MKFKYLLTLGLFGAMLGGCASSKTPTKFYPQNSSGEILNANLLISKQENGLKEASNARFLTSQQEVFDEFGGLALANLMQQYIGKKDGRDCSGFVLLMNKNVQNAYFDEANLLKFYDSRGRKSQAIFNLYEAQNLISKTSAKIGDLVFFYNTTSDTKNKNKLFVTHVGIVNSIGEDGTIGFTHNASGKNKNGFINLSQKNRHKAGKKEINSYIVSCKGQDAKCLASNKFAGFGRVKF